MPVVRVEPAGFLIDVGADETLIEAAWRLGYFWPTQCYGQAECTACNVEVLEGVEHASEVGDEEAATLATMGRRRARVRLACRVTFAGAAVVRKRGVRAPP
ncbi:MAG TPA: 2Fe-2S iron-sulfur cluster-binding protein [Acidimicrobiales bacterium]|nr:2Fe-2S iron-sulfur cluster-binding protein [Acidimicrobiales bacterium]